MDPVAKLVIDTNTLTLSQSLRVELQIEGAAPLRVFWPRIEALLDPNSARVWNCQPVGNARRESQASGQERWIQEYRFDPFVPGDPLTIRFSPIRVQAGTAVEPANVAIPGVDVKATTTLTADSSALRPVTGIESLPEVHVQQAAGSYWAIAAVGILIALTGITGLIWLWKRRNRFVPLTHWQILEVELTEIEKGEISTVDQARRLAQAIREAIMAHSAIVADRKTTAELLEACPGVVPLKSVMEECDRIRFAGSGEEVQDLRGSIEAVRKWAAELAAGSRYETGT